MPKLFAHDSHWFRETEEGKPPLPGSPAYKPPMKQSTDFWPQNPHSVREMIAERSGKLKPKETIQNPVIRRILELEENE